eukprot:COSAG06_NODE_4071_length_4604_cov_1.827119_2_plen_117_part_00
MVCVCCVLAALCFDLLVCVKTPAFVRLVNDHTTHHAHREQIQLVPQAALGEVIERRLTATADGASSHGGGDGVKDTLSGWNVLSVEAREFPHLDWSVTKLTGGGVSQQQSQVYAQV